MFQFTSLSIYQFGEDTSFVSLCYGGLSVTSEFNFFKTFHHTVLPMSPTPYEVGEDTYTALHDGKQL